MFEGGYDDHMAELPERKQIRLNRTLYRVPGTMVSITIGIDQRVKAFEDADLTRECIDLLRERSTANRVSVLAYCFMPDHTHLLIGLPAAGDLVEFMRDYKSRSTRVAWSHGHPGRFWQRGYYDHILREHEDPVKQIRYILGNPVRSGLVDQWDQYPFIGSFEFDIHLPENWESANNPR
jgi:putative transposase